jgi:hypothetical protein
LTIDVGVIPCSALYACWMCGGGPSRRARAHRSGDPVGVEDAAPLRFRRRAAHRLDQRAVGAEESLLVRIEDRDQRYLGQVEPFAQQVDAHQHVELAEPEPAKDLHPLDRVDVGVEIAHPHAVLLQVVGQIFRHPLGQRGHQHPLPLATRSGSREQIVHLPLTGRTRPRDRPARSDG